MLDGHVLFCIGNIHGIGEEFLESIRALNPRSLLGNTPATWGDFTRSLSPSAEAGSAASLADKIEKDFVLEDASK